MDFMLAQSGGCQIGEILGIHLFFSLSGITCVFTVLFLAGHQSVGEKRVGAGSFFFFFLLRLTE